MVDTGIAHLNVRT